MEKKKPISLPKLFEKAILLSIIGGSIALMVLFFYFIATIGWFKGVGWGLFGCVCGIWSCGVVLAWDGLSIRK